MTRWLSKRLTCAILIAGLIAVCSTRLLAHPTAPSFVVVEVEEGRRVVVSITTDAQSLLLKLQDPASEQALAGALLHRIELDADSSPLPLTFDRILTPAGKPEQVRVILSAPIANGVDRLAWRTSLFSAYPVAFRPAGAPPPTADDYEWLGADEWSSPHSLRHLSPGVSPWKRAASLIALGFTHIVPLGLDHMLFVLGLFLLASRTRTLLLQISAFTVAHSVTLALAALGTISVPASVVEPLIAVSIAYIAIENLMTTSISKWRLAVVFGFGLLHGLGFAGALAELGISRAELPVTLVGFNVGVELGQLAVVLAAAVVLKMIPVASEHRRRYLTNPASAAIAAIGLFWAVERSLFN